MESTGPGALNYPFESLGRPRSGVEFDGASKPESHKSKEDKKDKEAKTKKVKKQVLLPQVVATGSPPTASETRDLKAKKPKPEFSAPEVNVDVDGATASAEATKSVDLTVEEATRRLREQAEIAALIEKIESTKLKPSTAEIIALTQNEVYEGEIILHPKPESLEAELETAVLAAEQEVIISNNIAEEQSSSHVAAPAENIKPAIPETPTGSGGGGGDLPPHAETGLKSPEPEPQPAILLTADYYNQQLSEILGHPTITSPQEAAAANSFNPNIAKRPEQDLNDVAIRAEQYGTRRGLLTGLFVGGLIEHTRHKRRERRQARLAESQQAAQNKQISRLQFEQQEQLLKTGTLDRQFNHFRRLTNLELAGLHRRTIAERIPNQPQAERLAAKPEQPHQKVFEQREALRPPEEIDEPAQLAPGRRLETSAWHRIEVDTKTGKAVEQPTLAYGHEFWQEHQAESLAQLNVANNAMANPELEGDGNTFKLPIPGQVGLLATASRAKPKRRTADGKFADQRQLAAQMASTVPLWAWVFIAGMIAVIITLIVR